MERAKKVCRKTGEYSDSIRMKEHLNGALQIIEDDYRVCFRIIERYFDYLDTCGLKEFNRYSKYKWSFDRDKSNGFSYVCIRYRSSLMRKCLVKKRSQMEDDDMYKWVKNKELIREALDEAYQYIVDKINAVKSEIEEIKEFAEDYDEKLEDISEDFDKTKFANKRLSGAESLDGDSVQPR
ncbi:MAG: hypothetical protein LBR47_01880 [Spirochaetaceae bacterium]|nr:hypothetical protein [Spirochaetaceae bacterium]